MIRELTIAAAIAGAAIALAPSAAADPGPMYPDNPGLYDTSATDVPGMNYQASLGAPCDNYQPVSYTHLTLPTVPAQWRPRRSPWRPSVRES